MLRNKLYYCRSICGSYARVTYCFSLGFIYRTDRENDAENMLGKKQFARFRIFQNGVGSQFNVIFNLVMLTFRTEVISRYSDDTFGHALDSC